MRTSLLSHSAQPVPTAPGVSTPRILLRCLRFLRPYWPMTAGAYLALLGIDGITLAIPQFIRWIVDHAIGAGDAALLPGAVLGLLLLTLGGGVLTFWQGRWTEQASQHVAYDLRNALHRQLAALSFSYHDRTTTGQLLARTMQDVERVRFVTGRAFLRVADSLVLLIGSAAVLLLMNPRLALLALLTMPVLLHRAAYLGVHLRPLSQAVQNQLAVLTTRLEQNLRGARVVKVFAQEEAEIARFAQENERWFALSVAATRLQAINAPLMDLLTNLSTVIILWYGGQLVVQGQLTLGALVAFTAYLGQLAVPVRRLGQLVPNLATAAAAAARIFEILDARSEVRDAPDAIPLPPVQGRVVFDQVGFTYFGRERVLDDISFAVQPGQVIALLGTTGSGKSTLINLIPCFYDVTAGRITIDGYDLREVTLASLRDQIALVLQETTLFATTIRANIAFGRPAASDEEIVAAAQAAQAHDFILATAQGYETTIGERGITLSGGQRQRIAIARALLKDPRILILDDATASVDPATEQLIQQALARLMQGRTAFVIAQRLATLRRADLILVLEHGRIAARGTHAELLRTSGLYAAIYQQQIRGQADGAPGPAEVRS
jgi:ATP-binding cassette subfamily B protein